MSTSINKKRIIVLSHSSSVGGAELALASLIESTRNMYDWHLVIADSKKAPKKLTQYSSKVSYLDLPWWCYEAHGSPKITSKNVITKNMRKLQSFAGSADYLFTNTITIPWLSFVARKLNKPHIWYVHEFGDIDHNLQFITGYKSSLKTISDNSTRVLTISTAVKQHLEQVIPSKQIDLIYQAIDIDHLLEIPVKPLGIESQVKLLSIGAIKPSKGQDIAIDAVKLIQDKYNITLDVVGPNANDPYVQKLLKSDSKNIHVQPRAYDVVKELSSHDTVLMCSSNEAMGRVTLEALAAGKLVVGYDCIATKELLSNNRGIIYAPNNPQALAEALIKSLSHPFDAEKNRDYVVNTFNPVKQANDLAGAITNAEKSPTKVGANGLSLEAYVMILEEKKLFLGGIARNINSIKKPIIKLLPNSAKKIIRKVLR